MPQIISPLITSIFKWKLLLLIITAPLIPALVSFWILNQTYQLPPPPIPELELKQITNDKTIIWIDARSEKQYLQAHLPSAFLLNKDVWDQNLPKVLQACNTEQQLIVYCESQYCREAHKIASRLMSTTQQKYNIYVLRGGWQSYQSFHTQ